MTRFRLIHKITSVILINAVISIIVLGVYPVPTLSCSRVRFAMPSQLHVQTVVGPMLLKILRNSLHNKNDLNLSDDQSRRIKAEFQQFQQHADDIRQEFQISKQGLLSQRTHHRRSSKDSRFETRQYMARLWFQELYVRHITAILTLLTPEQQEKLRHRGLTVLMIYTLGAAFRKIAAAQQTEDIRPIPPDHIDRNAEYLPLPGSSTNSPVDQHDSMFPPTNSLEQPNILRI